MGSLSHRNATHRRMVNGQLKRKKHEDHDCPVQCVDCKVSHCPEFEGCKCDEEDEE